jgi:hypothetical protein
MQDKTILDNLIKLKPSIDLGFQEKCPECQGNLIANDFYIFGWRNLAKGVCGSCKKEFVFDMPAGHGICYTTFLESKGNKSYFKEGNSWFTDKFAEKWFEKNQEKIIFNYVKNNKKHEKAIVVNCLDFCYGHSLIKLFSATYYLKNNYQQEYDIVILAPKNLLYLMPQEADVVIISQLPFSKMKEFYVDIDGQLKDFFANYSQVCISPTPPHLYAKNYDLKLMNLPDPDYSQPIKNVCFAYRKDRFWGLSPRCQKKRIERLFSAIKNKYPDLSFFLVGEKDDLKFSQFIIDKRTEKISQETEKEWNKILSGALVVGLHGSNIMIASALAKYVIELMSESRYDNSVQASLISGKMDSFQLLHKFRYVYGSDNLVNVDSIVKNLALNILFQDADNIALYYQNSQSNRQIVKQAYASAKFQKDPPLFFVKVRRRLIKLIKKILR